MIWQIGDSPPFDFAYIASDLGKTGLTVTIKAAYKNGVAIAALAGVAIPEIGNGLYRYLLDGATYVDAAGDYVIIATTADTSVDQRDLYAVNVVAPWVANVDAAVSSRAVAGDAMALTSGERTTLAGEIDTELSGTHGAGSWETSGGSDYTEVLNAIKAKTDRIGTGTATLVAPVTRSGQVRIIQGDAYYNTDSGRALDWSDDTWNVAETSTVVVVLHGVITFVAERLSATQIRLELSSAQTLVLPVGNAVFSVQEITAEGNTLSRVPYGAWNTAAQPVPVYTP